MASPARRPFSCDEARASGSTPTAITYRQAVCGVGNSMKARQIIDGASFGPEALEAIGQAFDGAWEQIAGNFGSDPNDIERARHRLATALLSVATEDSRDVPVLVRAALETMALSYRSRSTGGSQVSA